VASKEITKLRFWSTQKLKDGAVSLLLIVIYVIGVLLAPFLIYSISAAVIFGVGSGFEKITRGHKKKRIFLWVGTILVGVVFVSMGVIASFYPENSLVVRIFLLSNPLAWLDPNHSWWHILLLAFWVIIGLEAVSSLIVSIYRKTFR